MKDLHSEKEAGRFPGGTEQGTRARANFAGTHHWWRVRGALWAALLLVCSVSATVTVHGEVRSAMCATVIRPLAASANRIADWTGWAAVGFATAAGTLAAALLRRGKGRAPSSFAPRAE